MRLLLDTHVVIWLTGGDRRLSTDLLATLQDAETEIYVSIASFWEISIKRALGKLASPSDLPERLSVLGVRLLPINLEHVWTASELPRHHGDPFDRLLVRQALAEDLTLVTQDRKLQAYACKIWLT